MQLFVVKGDLLSFNNLNTLQSTNVFNTTLVIVYPTGITMQISTNQSLFDEMVKKIDDPTFIIY